jgi:hypothetical protein
VREAAEKMIQPYRELPLLEFPVFLFGIYAIFFYCQAIV